MPHQRPAVGQVKIEVPVSPIVVEMKIPHPPDRGKFSDFGRITHTHYIFRHILQGLNKAFSRYLADDVEWGESGDKSGGKTGIETHKYHLLRFLVIHIVHYAGAVFFMKYPDPAAESSLPLFLN